jgi:hypothetical protein
VKGPYLAKQLNKKDTRARQVATVYTTIAGKTPVADRTCWDSARSTQREKETLFIGPGTSRKGSGRPLTLFA